ncbi:MAG: zinc-binding dehydrogenase [Acidimicrobiales bacterium]
MLAVVCVGDGRVEVQERPDPSPSYGEVVVRVKAAGLNGADLLQARGLYPAPPGSPPDIPGLELAGEVESVGPGSDRFAVGDKVMGVVGGGGQAERCAVHERCLVPVPTGLEWTAAGGFPEAFTTAHDALFTQCDLAMGDHVLVHGAAGGVGSAAVQLACLAGAQVTATVRNAELRGDVTRLGGPRGWVKAVDPADYEDGGPYDVILELVGAGNLAGNLRALATGGRISIIGVGGSGSRSEIDLLGLMAKRGRIHGSTLRARPLEQKADAARRIEHHVLPALAAGELRVPVAAAFHLEEATVAYERFAAGAKLGKVVLEV